MKKKLTFHGIRLFKTAVIAAGVVTGALLVAGFGCTPPVSSPVDGNNVVLAVSGMNSPFRIAVDEYAAQDSDADAQLLSDLIGNRFCAAIEKVKGNELTSGDKYIVAFGAPEVSECAALQAELKANEYAVRISRREDSGAIIVSIAYKSGAARKCVIDRLMKEFCPKGAERFAIPDGTDIRGSVDPASLFITTGVSLRDPCVLVENGTYYMYGTKWVYYKNTSGRLDGEWEGPFDCVQEKPVDSDKEYWAPEVHKYNGKHYMFTTYHSTANDHRGCVILCADTPEGPFEMISSGHVTPGDWDCIDGTLYIDGSGKPWMALVHEWTCTADNVGRMAVAPMSGDLTKLSGTPKDIFGAKDAPWATGNITDGPWLYTCENGTLLMLWSNFDAAGYSVGMARSKNGRIDGQWEQLPYQLFSKSFSGAFDGGHCMIFTDTDGQMYMSLHSPNSKTGDRKTLAVFVPVREESGLLIWDIYK